MEPNANKHQFVTGPPTITSPSGLLLACLGACLGVIASRYGGLPGAGIVISTSLAIALGTRQTSPWLFAVPAALGAVLLPSPQLEAPREGPVMLQGDVEGDIRLDRTLDRCQFKVRTAGGLVSCSGPVARVFLPGDRVRGIAFATGKSYRGLPELRVEPDALEIESWRPTPRRFAVALRFALAAELQRAIPGPRGHLLCHLVLGSGPRLSEQVLTDHRATGLTHLLAVSGAHASMLAWLLGVIFMLTSGRHPWSSRGYRRFCAIVLLIYGSITGWEPPVFRALVAYATLLVATGKTRRMPITATLALPALLTALLFPSDLFSASFCLSYAAVFGLVCAGVLKDQELWAHWLRAPLRASCWAVLTTSPFALYYFGQIAPWTILATPVLGPVVAVMLALGLLTALVGLVAPSLAAVIAVPLSSITGFYQFSVECLAELPLTPIFSPERPSSAVLLAFILIGLICLCLRPDRRGVAYLCICASLPHFLPLAAQTANGITLLDVGHGQACLLHLSNGETALVDCGSMGSKNRAARAVDRALSRRHIDWLILSHADADHTGSVNALLDRMTIGTAILPRAMRRHPLSRRLETEGCRIHWLDPGQSTSPVPGLRIRAPKLRTGSSNARSLWVDVQINTLRVVLPGDAETTAILDWLRHKTEADVLILPHHGREDTPAALLLLRRLGASMALASNRDRAPAPLVDRVRAAAVPVYTTATHGSIRLTIDADRMWSIATERQPRRPTNLRQAATVSVR